MASNGHSSPSEIGDIRDLEDIDGAGSDIPSHRERIIDYERRSESDLPLLRRLQLKLFGYAYVGHRRLPGWKGSLPFYVFRCQVHGLVVDYPHGYGRRLDCPLCLREDELISVFYER